MPFKVNRTQASSIRKRFTLYSEKENYNRSVVTYACSLAVVGNMTNGNGTDSTRKQKNKAKQQYLFTIAEFKDKTNQTRERMFCKQLIISRLKYLVDFCFFFRFFLS